MNEPDTPELLAPSRRKKPYKYKRQKQRPRIVNPKQRHTDVAKGYLEEGKSFAESMRDAGYPESQTNKGIRYQFKVSGLMREAFRREMDEMCKMADRADLTDSRMGLIARLTLVRNAIHGEEKRSGSTYAAVSIGKMKGVDLFERDIQVGVLAMSVPPEWKDRYSLEEGKSDMERDLEHITNTRIDNAELAKTPPFNPSSPEQLPSQEQEEKSDEPNR
jgi:hypothetical protein